MYITYMYIAWGCESRADLVSNSVTRVEFDYVGSLTLHNARVHAVGWQLPAFVSHANVSIAYTA